MKVTRWLGALALTISASAVAQVKISQLPAASTLSGSEEIPLVQSGTTKYATPTQIQAYIFQNPVTVAEGGTGLAAGTAGGLLYFSASGTIASSSALTANGLVLGGGSGGTPTTLSSLGTATTVLHGNASGAPTFGSVNLATDVTGSLPLTGLGTISPGTIVGVQAGASTATPSALPVVYVNCTGTESIDQAQLTAAVASGYNVQLIGICHTAIGFTLAAGQGFGGQSPNTDGLYTGYDFSTSATAVLTPTGSSLNAPRIHDMGFFHPQPAETSTSTTAASSSGANTITVASVTGIVAGSYVYDSTTTTAVPAFTTIASIAGNTLTLSANLAANVGSGDTIKVDVARANATTLTAGCSSAAICEYPPDINLSASSRWRLDNLHFDGSWDCIKAVGNSTGWITNVEAGCIDIGLNANGAQDSMHVKGFHHWQFGFTASSPYTAWGDGFGVAMQLGRIDGFLADSVTTEDTAIAVSSAASASEGGWVFSGLNMDGTNTSISVAGAGVSGIQIQGGEFSAHNASSRSAYCPFMVTGGTVQVTNWTVTVGSDNQPAAFCVMDGYLVGKNNIFTGNSGSTPAVYQTASGTAINGYTSDGLGAIDLENNRFTLPAAITATAYINANGTGSVTLRGNKLVSASGNGSGAAVIVSNDNQYNYVEVCASKFSYTVTYPSGTNGYYQSCLFQNAAGAVNVNSNNSLFGGTGTVTSSGAFSATRFIPTAATVPGTSGIYSASASSLSFAAGGVEVGNYTNTLGTLYIPEVSAGTVATVSGCTASAITGGTSTGSFTVGAGASPCTFVFTIPATAPHGWLCEATDETAGLQLVQSAHSTTTCSLKGNVATSDTIVFSVVRGY